MKKLTVLTIILAIILSFSMEPANAQFKRGQQNCSVKQTWKQKRFHEKFSKRIRKTRNHQRQYVKSDNEGVFRSFGKGYDGLGR